MCVWVYICRCSVTRLCLTFCGPMDYSPCSVHRIFQARTLEQVATFPYSRESSWPKDWTHISCVCCIGWNIFYYYSYLVSPTYYIYVYIYKLHPAYIHIHTHTHTYIYTYTCICIHTYIYTHTYIYIHIHVYTHTRSWAAWEALCMHCIAQGTILNTLWSMKCVSRSVMSNSLRPHGLWPARHRCPWDFPSKNTGVGCHFLLQGIFPTQGLNPGLLHCRWIIYHLSHQGSPISYSNL